MLFIVSHTGASYAHVHFNIRSVQKRYYAIPEHPDNSYQVLVGSLIVCLLRNYLYYGIHHTLVKALMYHCQKQMGFSF